MSSWLRARRRLCCSPDRVCTLITRQRGLLRVRRCLGGTRCACHRAAQCAAVRTPGGHLRLRRSRHVLCDYLRGCGLVRPSRNAGLRLAVCRCSHSRGHWGRAGAGQLRRLRRRRRLCDDSGRGLARLRGHGVDRRERSARRVCLERRQRHGRQGELRAALLASRQCARQRLVGAVLLPGPLCGAAAGLEDGRRLRRPLQAQRLMSKQALSYHQARVRGALGKIACMHEAHQRQESAHLRERPERLRQSTGRGR